MGTEKIPHARKQKSAGESGALDTGYNAQFRGYINLVLSPDQKAAFDLWATSASVLDALDTMAGDGVHLTVKWDAKAKCYLASGTQRREDSPNAGLVVTARADNATKALFRLLYCLVVLSHAERWEDTQPMADPDRW